MMVILIPAFCCGDHPNVADFSELFALLRDVKGHPSFPAIMERLVNEANRFKRKTLAEQLARQVPPLGMHSNTNGGTNNGCSLWRMAAAQNSVKR